MTDDDNADAYNAFVRLESDNTEADTRKELQSLVFKTGETLSTGGTI